MILQALSRFTGHKPCNTERSGDIMAVLADCSQKCKLYIAHVMPCHVQEKPIEAIIDKFRQRGLGFFVLFVVLRDYKMKIKPLIYLEATAQCFCKNRISWHGAVIFLCR